MASNSSSQPPANKPGGRKALAQLPTRSRRRSASHRLPSRVRIIDAALKLLSEGGYSALSIAAICKQADVATASLYHHFGDKAGLLKAMIAESVDDAAMQFYQAVQDQDNTVDQLLAYIDVMRELGRDYRFNAIGVVSALAQGCGEAPEIMAAIEEARQRAWHFAAAEMSDAFGIGDGMLVAHLQFAFATYIIQVAHSSTDREDVRGLYQSFQRIFITMIGALRPDIVNDPRYAEAVAAATASATGTPPL